MVKEIKKEEKLLVAIFQDLKESFQIRRRLDTLRLRYAVVYQLFIKKANFKFRKNIKSLLWGQAIYRTKYLKIISEIDQKTHDTIRSLLIQIGKQKLELEAVLRKKND
ncbi:MAG: hypothetical protein CM1200mP1_16670 [Candidatus Neomarinimicrobiota bacterium]|nr:MAG: hypothetical protein CM1200mP1_16670 [Candidatus Neomarinimicrobiota bacterium]